MTVGDHLVDVGWTVVSRDGEELGTIGTITQDVMEIVPRAPDGQRLRIPAHYITDEDAAHMVAILSLDARDARTAIVPT